MIQNGGINSEHVAEVAGGRSGHFRNESMKTALKCLGVLLAGRGMPCRGSENFRVVEAPTPRGIILCRTLITDEHRISEMTRVQHQAAVTEMDR